MKKSEVKKVIEIRMKSYYDAGLTNTADKVRSGIFKDLDKLWDSKKRNKR